jgi:hypothetical protein
MAACSRSPCCSAAKASARSDIEQASARVLARSEARLQSVANRHEIIELGGDTVLFRQWWDQYAKKCLFLDADLVASCLCQSELVRHKKGNDETTHPDAAYKT